MASSQSPSDKSRSARPLSVAVVTCAVLEDEIHHFARNLKHIVAIEMLQQGLHNEPDKLRCEVQHAVDRIEAAGQAHTIVLGYGLCSRGVEGVRAQRCRLVLARAHDCITLLLGCQQRYANYVAKHPGTYWYSPGWNRHHTPPGKQRHDQLFQQYRAKYGEDNAEYLMQMEQHWFTTYDRATFVDLGVTDTQQDVEYTQQCADWLGWAFDRQQGDPELLRTLLSGPWDADRFLVLEAGQTARMTADARIVEAVTESEFVEGPQPTRNELLEQEPVDATDTAS